MAVVRGKPRGPAPEKTPPPRPDGAAVSPAGGESRYGLRRPAGPGARRVLRLVLTEPDTVAMTDEQHQQAVAALAAMIVAWLQRRAHDGISPPVPGAASPDESTRPRGRDRRTA